jgi:chromosome condensin MukBEF ATPase and DNA-binding subunit MukB
MIFTRKQYAIARTEHASFYRLLDALIMTNTILMVGVGLDDPDFQLLFEDNRARFQNALPHYMTYGGNPHVDLLQTTRDTLGTKLLPYSPRKNHASLVTALKSLAIKVSDRRSTLARTMDW